MIVGEVKTAAIIGAGVSGLATAKCLTRVGIHCTVIDRNPYLGGVWADGYHDFGVQVQKDLYEFPDFPLSEEASHFTPGPIFREYLEDYCDHFGIRECLRLGTRITMIERKDDRWSLEVEGSESSESIEADLVVVAAGLYSETPNVPNIPKREEFGGEVLHASEIKDISQLKGRRVAVIGYGKSATDIAGSAVETADKIHLVFRTAHWPVPRKLLGVLPFKWGMLTRLVAALIPPYVRPSPIVRAIHSIGYPLPWLFWRVVELLLSTQQGLRTQIARGETLMPETPVEFDAFTEVTMVPRPGLIDFIRSGKISAHRTGVSAFSSNGIDLADGDSLEVDCVVFGTGWKTGYTYLPKSILTALGDGPDGFYLYRHVLHPSVPNLAFVGRASSFMSVTTFALQAKWLAEVVAGRVLLPDAEAMQSDIEALKTWKQSWMPEGPARSATLLLHMCHYHDELLLDMSADPLRKRGFLAPIYELIVPYRAADFRDVV